MDGYIKWLRDQIGPQKIVLVFASICIVDSAGRLLWQKRGDFRSWGLPGGALELDEDLSACAIREAKEETGLDVALHRVIGVYSSPDYDVLYPNGDEVQQVTFCFLASPRGGSLQVDQKETLALNWYGRDEVPDTAIWYQHMASDLFENRSEATFKRGRRGKVRSSDPWFMSVRKRVGPAPLIVPVATMAAFDEQGRILLAKRVDNGNWSLPGGMLELGERLDQTAAAEIEEETGLVVEPERLLGIYSDRKYEFKYPHGDEVKVVSSLFRCRIVGGTLQPDGEEISETRFFAPDALPDLRERQVSRVADAIANRPGVVVG